jgi:tRNA(fMet)-specific endonuclease VapC
VDLVVAETFGTLRAELFDRGRVIASQDLWNASIAIVQNLTVVTHNTQDYQGIAGLRVEDWLSP